MANTNRGHDGTYQGNERRSGFGSFVRWAMIFGGLLGVIVVVALMMDSGPKAGESEPDGAIDGTVRSIARGVRETSATVGEGFESARESATNLGMVQQIETRLSQDKAVVADGIEVAVEEEGTATLSGLVPSQACKEKAVSLTRDTRGVVRVIDRLAVTPPDRIILAPAAEAVPEVASRPIPRN